MSLYINGELVGSDSSSQSGKITYPSWTYACQAPSAPALAYPL